MKGQPWTLPLLVGMVVLLAAAAAFLWTVDPGLSVLFLGAFSILGIVILGAERR